MARTAQTSRSMKGPKYPHPAAPMPPRTRKMRTTPKAGMDGYKTPAAPPQPIGVNVDMAAPIGRRGKKQ